MKEQALGTVIFESEEEALRSKVQQQVVKCKHYSASVRKEAFIALSKQFKELEVGQLEMVVPLLSEAIAKGFIDTDDGVRSVAMGMVHLLLRRTQAVVLSAVFPTWMQFCLLSLTHIEPAIKADGITFIGTVLELQPTLLVVHLIKILENLLLGVSCKSAKQSRKGVPSELSVLLSILRLYTKVASTKLDQKVYPEYTWSEVQRANLGIVRRPMQTSGVDLVPEPLARLITEKLLAALSDAWLMLGEQLHGDVLDGEAAFALDSFRELLSFISAAGLDAEEMVWKAIPRAMLNVLGKDGKSHLRRHIHNRS